MQGPADARIDGHSVFAGQTDPDVVFQDMVDIHRDDLYLRRKVAVVNGPASEKFGDDHIGV